MNAIEFHSVSKIHGSRHVIDSLSLTIEEGERIVLFGPSGCGKSTILHLIAGLVTPDMGDIRIGEKIASSARHILIPPQARGIGMVFQDLALWPHMSVAENVAFGLRAQRVSAEDRKQKIREIAGLVGLGNYLNAKPGTLSGGEQQRVALARALVLKPRILLMDEPLSALDDVLNRTLRQEILRLHGELGFTLVYVTHNRSEAEEIGTRTVHLSHGRLV